MLTPIARSFWRDLHIADSAIQGKHINRDKMINGLIGHYHSEHAVREPSPEQHQLAAEMYSLYCQGRSCVEVGRAFGVGRETAREVMTDAGYKLREKGAVGQKEMRKQREVG